MVLTLLIGKTLFGAQDLITPLFSYASLSKESFEIKP